MEICKEVGLIDAQRNPVSLNWDFTGEEGLR
jgi:hypothetical protein